MSQPESYGAPPTWDEKSRGEARDPAAGQRPRDVTEVARTLAAHGGGAASLDLALDLVLNEVVEQARVATGATGAAIAFSRESEMVCRATSGENAPELGVRLETTSGLSGACLQSGKVQQCSDTETDSRVDAEACRILGVRSILVLPLSDGKETFGLFEIFSSRPDAFGDRDVNTLQALARRVVTNKKGAESVAAAIRSASETPRVPSIQPKALLEDDELRQPDAVNLGQEAPPRRIEVWTSILGVLVILVAVLLGLALGWRAGLGSSVQGTSALRTAASSIANAKPAPDSAAEQKTTPVGSGAMSLSTSVPQTKQAKAATSTKPTDGGLQVTQNGKVIYRSPPVDLNATPAKHAAPQRSDNASASRLIYRVEPLYPPEARAQQIQGAVTLDVQIGGEGTVHNIEVVEGNPMLAEAAVQAVRQWKYRPYSVDGRPVEMQTRVTIRFTLPPT